MSRTGLLCCAACAAAVAGLAGLALRIPAAVRADRWLFAVLNGAPELLRGPLWMAQLSGVLWAPALVAAGAVAARRFRLAAALLLLPPAKLAVEFEVLKVWFQHPRPGVLIPDAVVRAVPLAGNAFPSGHAIILGGAVTLLLPVLRGPGRAAVVAVGVLAAVARVYLGAHTPLDVLGGAAAGVALGAVLTAALRPCRSRDVPVPIGPADGDQQPSPPAAGAATVQE